MLRLVAHHCLAKHSAFGNFRRTLRRLRKLVRDFQKLQKPIHQTRKDKQTERSGLSIIEKNYRESFWFIGQRVVGSCQRCVRVLWQKREQTVCFRTARVVRKQDLSLTQCARAELAANGDHSANRQREQAALHAFATFRGERRSVGACVASVAGCQCARCKVYGAKCTLHSVWTRLHGAEAGNARVLPVYLLSSNRKRDHHWLACALSGRSLS